MFRSAIFALVTLSAPVAAESWQPEEAAMRGHVGFLASDEMKGREAGTPEYDIAARYVAAQFETMGLKPAGAKDSYIPPVPLVTFRAADKGSVMLVRGAAETALAFGVDYLPGASPLAPELNHFEASRQGCGSCQEAVGGRFVTGTRCDASHSTI